MGPTSGFTSERAQVRTAAAAATTSKRRQITVSTEHRPRQNQSAISQAEDTAIHSTTPVSKTWDPSQAPASEISITCHDIDPHTTRFEADTPDNHKTASPQQGSSNGGVKATVADDVINGKQQGNSNQSHAIRARSPPPPPSPRSGAVINNGEKKFIMMAGENVGAYMELGSPPIGQHISRKQHHGYILQHQDKGIESESEREPTSKGKGREKMSVAEGKPKVAVVNSNVQSVNNSVISGSSCTQQSPGVHATIISRRQPNHKGATHQ
ncbi:uncharacterized protein A4U43_C02F17480 [Asparagus officinalis]|uniref:Uncharacterized protein n=1 Tax=Asparagus officinalis TaxID=4686 RepID=A0A5P1FJ40_ASPOF|nr:uncharacterized protein A4U43_C02F17480 [Asparagus officinalis]